MKRITCTLLFSVLFFTWTAHGQTGTKKYVFYLHGRIVEVQGANAVSEQYGKYEYENIVDAFKGKNIVVISEVRPADTKIKSYAGKVVREIDSLLRKGVPPGNVTVIGASKGALIAMQVSTDLKNKEVNYVFIAGSFRSVEQFGFDLYGNILGIYEKSDPIAGNSYRPLIKSSTGVGEFKEIELNTGLGHGIVFKPLDAWVVPAKKWISGRTHSSE
ncbi:MAG: alpha/beta hydrolase [Chlorobi bacterium]|nr:alpha/beta hydrolase [Chlorobiota bacterium]